MSRSPCNYPAWNKKLQLMRKHVAFTSWAVTEPCYSWKNGTGIFRNTTVAFVSRLPAFVSGRKILDHWRIRQSKQDASLVLSRSAFTVCGARERVTLNQVVSSAYRDYDMPQSTWGWIASYANLFIDWRLRLLLPLSFNQWNSFVIRQWKAFWLDI